MRQSLNEVRKNAKGEVVFESQWFGPQIILPRKKRICCNDRVEINGCIYHAAELDSFHGSDVFVETMPWDDQVVYVYDKKGKAICAAQLEKVMRDGRFFPPPGLQVRRTNGYSLTRIGGKWRLAFVDNLYYRSFYADSYSELEAQLVRWLRS